MIQPALTYSRQPQELLESINRQLAAEHNAHGTSRYGMAAFLARYDIRLLVRLAYDLKPKRRKARRLPNG